MDKDLLEILACPKCHGELNQQNQQLICGGCKLSFPIKDGIPVLLIEEVKTIK